MKLHKAALAAAMSCFAITSASVYAAGDGTSTGSNATPPTMNSPSRGDASMGASGIRMSGQMDSSTVRQAQQALASKGHDPGPIDGIMGARTRSALQDYQRSQSLSGATGLDQRTLESLGVQASASGSMGSNGGMTGSGGGGSAGQHSPTPDSTGTTSTPNQNPTGITPGSAPR